MRLAVIGAGGLAREVAWLISDIQNHQSMNEIAEPLELAGCLVSDLSKVGPRDSNVIGDFSWLESNKVDGLVMAIGNPAVRLRLSAELKQRFPHLSWPNLIHPSVQAHESCRFGEGVIVAANCILAPNSEIHDFALVNFACFVGHESIIGAGSVVNPLVSVSGGVTIGKSVLVGAHSVILQYLTVEDYATIGAGSMAHQNVPSGATALGVPARLILKSAAASA